MKHVYFCRHGLSELGRQGLRAGSIDTPLTTEGREQAKAAGIEAGALHIDHIVASPLSRAFETATIIAGQIGYPAAKIEINTLTRERDFGSFEGKHWDPDSDIDGDPTAETATSLLQRARQVADHLRSLDADTILVVSHGAFGRALRHSLRPEIPFENREGFENAQIIQLL